MALSCRSTVALCSRPLTPFGETWKKRGLVANLLTLFLYDVFHAWEEIGSVLQGPLSRRR